MTILMEQLLQRKFEQIGARLSVRERRADGHLGPRFDRAASFSILVEGDEAGARYELVLDPALPPPRLEVVDLRPDERRLTIRALSAASNDRFEIECGHKSGRWYVAKAPLDESIVTPA
jgi:hypothetical protein